MFGTDVEKIKFQILYALNSNYNLSKKNEQIIKEYSRENQAKALLKLYDTI